MPEKLQSMEAMVDQTLFLPVETWQTTLSLGLKEYLYDDQTQSFPLEHYTAAMVIAAHNHGTKALLGVFMLQLTGVNLIIN